VVRENPRIPQPRGDSLNAPKYPVQRAQVLVRVLRALFSDFRNWAAKASRMTLGCLREELRALYLALASEVVTCAFDETHHVLAFVFGEI
jgi:hypothetical protein